MRWFCIVGGMIPPPEFFQHYFSYVIWGDLRQLEIVRQLPESEIERDRGFSFGSIRKVLAHEYAAQSVWLDRFEGMQAVWLGEDAKLGMLAKIAELWPALHERGRRYMSTLTAERLASNLNYTNLRGDEFSLPLWEVIFHMCQHSYYHRGQLNSMIKMSGGKPKSVDYSTWVAERSS